jgi:hypothetical protein
MESSFQPPTWKPTKSKTGKQMSNAKYPEVKVKLIGQDGNAFAIMGAVQKALKQHGVSKEEIDAYLKDSMSGDYNHLLQTAMAWVTVK